MTCSRCGSGLGSGIFTFNPLLGLGADLVSGRPGAVVTSSGLGCLGFAASLRWETTFGPVDDTWSLDTVPSDEDPCFGAAGRLGAAREVAVVEKERGLELAILKEEGGGAEALDFGFVASLGGPGAVGLDGVVGGLACGMGVEGVAGIAAFALVGVTGAATLVFEIGVEGTALAGAFAAGVAGAASAALAGAFGAAVLGSTIFELEGMVFGVVRGVVLLRICEVGVELVEDVGFAAALSRSTSTGLS